MAKNYDRERHRKDGQDQKVLGSPIIPLRICAKNCPEAGEVTQ